MRNTGFARQLSCCAAGALLLISAAGQAAGIFVPDNGSMSLGRGATDVGFLDTAFALQFNPAGMALGDGLDVRVDLNMINPGESFKPSNLNPRGVTVQNTSGLSLGPQVMVTYRLPMLNQLAFGLGVWGPPGVLSYKFPDPRDYSEPAAAAAQTPQRYNLISQNTLVLYPTVGVAYRPIRYISIGADLQYIYSTTSLTESLVGIPPADASLASLIIPGYNKASTANDIIASLSVHSVPRLSGIFGLVVQPIQQLNISGSFQPYQPIYETGTLGLDEGQYVKGTLGATSNPGLGVVVSPNPANAQLAINLPAILRTGASLKVGRFMASAEFVEEWWDVNQFFTLTTNATAESKGPGASLVNMSLCGSNTKTCPPLAIPPTKVDNQWLNAGSARGGVGYDFLTPREDGFLLEGNLGALYETNAIPYDTQSLPYVTGSRLGFSAGVILGWHGFSVSGAFMYYLPDTFTVSDSKIIQTSTVQSASGPPPTAIGDGIYRTNLWVVGVGLGYHFGANG